MCYLDSRHSINIRKVSMQTKATSVKCDIIYRKSLAVYILVYPKQCTYFSAYISADVHL